MIKENTRTLPSAPDYKALLEQALYHLRVVSGSRNSFTLEVRDRLYNLDQPGIGLRTPEVEAMHRDAYQWLKQHEHLIPQDQFNTED